MLKADLIKRMITLTSDYIKRLSLYYEKLWLQFKFKFTFFFQIPPSKLETCLNHLEQGYSHNGNPYHNNLHACDVLQTVHYFIAQTGLAVRFNFFRWNETVSCIFTARKKASCQQWLLNLGILVIFSVHGTDWFTLVLYSS